MRNNLSALKHGVAEADILHAAEHRAFESEPDDDMPAKQFISGNQLIIHAMKARRSVLKLLD